MTSVEVGNDEEGGPDEASTSAAGIQKKRFGRPKGGGGYVAGTVPTNTTVRPSLSRTERWKRKGTAFIPLEEAEQAVSFKMLLLSLPWNCCKAHSCLLGCCVVIFITGTTSRTCD
jgi:hypothetical protein